MFVTIGMQLSRLTRALSYGAAILTSTSPCNVASSGSTSVTVFGIGFGTVAYSQRTSMASSSNVATAFEGSVWSSDSVLTGRVVSGVGRGSVLGSLTATFGMQLCKITGMLSFNAASISSVSRGNTAASGSVSATVLGTGFGVREFSGRLRISMDKNARTSLECSVWRSGTSLSGRVASGVGSWIGPTIVIATVGMQLGSMTSVLSYDTVSLNATSPYNAATSGSISIIVFGRAYGAAGFSGCLLFSVALISFTPTASEYSMWMSDSSLSGRVASGVGTGFGGWSLVATVSTLLSSKAGVFSYNAASLSALRAGTTISVFGYGFAMYNPSPSCRIAQSPSSATIWSAGSFVVCKIGRVRINFSSTVILSQFKFISSLGNSFSFNVVSNFNITTLSSSPTTGGSLLLLAAENFGIAQLSSRLKFAASGCRSSVRI